MSVIILWHGTISQNNGTNSDHTTAQWHISPLVIIKQCIYVLAMILYICSSYDFVISKFWHKTILCIFNSLKHLSLYIFPTDIISRLLLAPPWTLAWNPYVCFSLEVAAYRSLLLHGHINWFLNRVGWVVQHNLSRLSSIYHKTITEIVCRIRWNLTTGPWVLSLSAFSIY